MYISVLTLLCPFFYQTFGCVREENARSSYFNVIPNHKLTTTAHTIRKTTAGSFTMCGQFCLREGNCFSFVYETRGQGESRTCELKRQVLNTDNHQFDLTYDENYDYATLENENECSSESTANKTTGREKKEQALNCTDLKNQGFPDGVHVINPDDKGNMTVFCDQTTDGGGWTVIQRRISPFNVSFIRSWGEYQLGFGDPRSEFWLGNDNIHRLTAAGLQELRIDLAAKGPLLGFAKYFGFHVASSTDKYRWSMNWRSGDIGNSIDHSNSVWNQTGMAFTTYDQDNDFFSSGNCAIERKSGWWYNYCGYSDLNKDGSPLWDSWPHVVVKTEMKLR